MTRSIARIALALFYLLAGVLHLAIPRPFLSIVPGWVPFPQTVVFWTGIAEVLGALTLAQPWSPSLRKLAGAGDRKSVV